MIRQEKSRLAMSDETGPWLSVVAPAFNEQKLLARSLESIRAAITANGLVEGQWELIVCDNASTDDTAQIAAQAGARVVYESSRQIASARNCGAASARGQWLLFVDADTWPDSYQPAAPVQDIHQSPHLGYECYLHDDLWFLHWLCSIVS